MKKYIQKLRAKPEEEKKHLVHIFTFVGAGLMIVLWTFTLGNSFDDPSLSVRVQEDLQPFKKLQANVIDGYNTLSNTSEDTTQ